MEAITQIENLINVPTRNLYLPAELQALSALVALVPGRYIYEIFNLCSSLHVFNGRTSVDSKVPIRLMCRTNFVQCRLGK